MAIQRKNRLLITFPSATMAMKMEDCCKKENMEGRLIPVPSEVRAGCGLCWSAAPGKDDLFTVFMKSHAIEWENMTEFVI